MAGALRYMSIYKKESRFITRECSEMLAGKTPCPYLRLHDTPQRMLAERRAALSGQSLSETAYIDRMIHFWREVSLAAMPRVGERDGRVLRAAI